MFTQRITSYWDEGDSALAWSADSRVVAFLVSSTITTYDAVSNAPMATFAAPAHDDYIRCDLSTCGARLVTLTAGGMVRLDGDAATERAYPGARMVMFMRDPRLVALAFDDRIEIVSV